MKTLIDKKIGMLTVIKKSSTCNLLDPDPNSLWECLCDCGNTREIKRNRLRRSAMRSGSILSCGCANKIKGIKLRKDPVLGSAKTAWNSKYNDGCSFEKFLELSQQPCFWCGALPNNKCTGSGKASTSNGISESWRKIKIENPFIYNGLDRLDNSRDHSEDNIVPCCADCNLARMDRTIEEFKEWIKRIYHFQFGT